MNKHCKNSASRSELVLLFTFWHLLQQLEEGTRLDEAPGLEEVHGGREVFPGNLVLLQFGQQSVQPLLSVRQHHPAARLHGRLQLHELLPQPGVRAAPHPDQAAKKQGGRRHQRAPQPDCHPLTSGEKKFK